MAILQTHCEDGCKFEYKVDSDDITRVTCTVTNLKVIGVDNSKGEYKLIYEG